MQLVESLQSLTTYIKHKYIGVFWKWIGESFAPAVYKNLGQPTQLIDASLDEKKEE